MVQRLRGRLDWRAVSLLVRCFSTPALGARPWRIGFAFLRTMITPALLLRRARERSAFAVLFVGVFATGLAPSADGDIWWHLAAAREMVRVRSFLWVDHFSSGAAGRPWI